MNERAARHDGLKPKARSRGWRRIGIVLLVIVVILAVVRAFMPMMVRDYVNRTLDKSPLYSGKIGDVQIHLWRGAYSIHDIQLIKTAGAVPVPLFAAKRLDLAVEWKALLHGRMVGRLSLDNPELNFVDAPSDGEAQTGAGGPWLQIISDLFPFKINSTVIRDGTIHFRAYQKAKPVDVYISQFQAKIDNLGNIRDDTNPLVSTVEASGLVMDQAKFEYKMTLDPFSYKPTFHMALRLLGLDVTKINDLALAYGKFDFKRGWFDLVVETDSKEGQITGYAKPLFRDLKVFSLTRDLQEDNMLQFFWQALVGGVTRLLTNQPRNQFGTLIPFHGAASGATGTDIFATIGNILRNAFVRAYLPRLEAGQETFEGMTFEAPKISDPITPAEAP